MSKTFADLTIDSDIVDSLASAGIVTPFPIQEQTIPLALAGQDIIGQAQTGTGKTLGFGIPVIQRLGLTPRPGMQALIVTPTRELAAQVSEDLVTAAAGRPTTVISIYGGKAYEDQIKQIEGGAQIVVGTPGRLLDLAGQGVLDLSNISEMVLDEADKMLDLGFLPDIEKLFSLTPSSRHTMLFSATMPGAIVALARQFMQRPVHIRSGEPDAKATQSNIRHLVFRAHALDKDEIVARILQAESRGKTVIFTRTKRQAAKLQEELNDRGFSAVSVHGDLNQQQRERAMAGFRSGKKDTLIATDVAARGIDVDDVTHVINYTIPEDDQTYLHRVGRTGRAGRTGVAITFVDWDDLRKWTMIDKALDFGQPEPTETYSSSPHLYSEVGIPEHITGSLKPGPTREAKPPRQRTRTEAKSGTVRTRRRTRGRSESPEKTAPQTTAEGTHDGWGTQHHDGNNEQLRKTHQRKNPGTTGPREDL